MRIENVRLLSLYCGSSLKWDFYEETGFIIRLCLASSGSTLSNAEGRGADAGARPIEHGPGLGCRVSGVGFRVYGLWFMV